MKTVAARRAPRGESGWDAPVENRSWIMTSHPTVGFNEVLRLESGPCPVAGAGQVLVRVLYLSVDPGQRTWMRAEGSYIPPLPLGRPMKGGILGRVISSGIPHIEIGMLISGMGEWADYCLLDKHTLRRLPEDSDIDPIAYLSALGPTGWTAYFGLAEVGKPVAGETIVISAAAGAVGSVAGQIGKAKGCRVIGIAGSEEKARWLCDALGFDAAINHRSADVGTEIDRLCPDGVDVYFENVGGALGTAIYPRMAIQGRIVLCGLASEYQDGVEPTTLALNALLMKRVTVGAFNISDYFPCVGEAIEALTALYAAKQIKLHVEFVDGLENAPAALNTQLQPGAAHRGKLLVRVAERLPTDRSA